MEAKIDFKNPSYYDNRELSWIKFDNRVLNEAKDKTIPLLERLKFVPLQIWMNFLWYELHRYSIWFMQITKNVILQG